MAVHYSHSAEGAKTIVKEITAFGGKVAAFQADFSEVVSLLQLAGQAVAFLVG